jgi:uncharacterized protein (TIGR00369 family)
MNFPESEEINERLGELKRNERLKVPPPIFTDMAGEFVSVDLEAKTLTVRFPVMERYQNPMGYMQGGMIAAAVDNAIGPLSFLVANANVTKTMEMNYLRPIPASVTEITVRAAFQSQNGRELVFVADVLRGDGSVLATARSVNILLKGNR